MVVANAQGGSDIPYRHTVSSEDVMNGADEEVEPELPTSCALFGYRCGGRRLGHVRECSGRGVLSRMVQMGPFQQDRTAPARAATGVERFRRPPARHARAAAERSNPPHFGSASRRS